MRFLLIIDSDNDAVADTDDARRFCRRTMFALAERLDGAAAMVATGEAVAPAGPVRDENGNLVGRWLADFRTEEETAANYPLGDPAGQDWLADLRTDQELAVAQAGPQPAIGGTIEAHERPERPEPIERYHAGRSWWRS